MSSHSDKETSVLGMSNGGNLVSVFSAMELKVSMNLPVV